MSELIPITVFAIVLAFLSHRASEYDPIRCCYGRQDRFWFGMMALALILFAGLRTTYNDTYNYRFLYNTIPLDTSFMRDVDWLKIGNNPGFVFTNNALVKLGVSTQSYLMFYSAIILGIYLWFFRKYTCNLLF